MGEAPKRTTDIPKLLLRYYLISNHQDASRVMKDTNRYSVCRYTTLYFVPYKTQTWLNLRRLLKTLPMHLCQLGLFEAIYVIAYKIRILAERADKELASIGRTPEKLKGVAQKNQNLLELSMWLASFSKFSLSSEQFTCVKVLHEALKLPAFFISRNFILEIRLLTCIILDGWRCTMKISPLLIKLLRCALQEHEDQFLRFDVYLVFKKLLKKIYIIQ
uniref:Uncharacterized protein n=1 Tax=Solanum lycopersicum TaxID=4081 RepID=A0A3Q7ITM4_SOLLC